MLLSSELYSTKKMRVSSYQMEPIQPASENAILVIILKPFNGQLTHVSSNRHSRRKVAHTDQYKYYLYKIVHDGYNENVNRFH